MYIRMKHKYSFIFQDNNVAIYDAEKDSFTFRMRLPSKHIENLIRRFRQPLCFDNEELHDMKIMQQLLSQHLSNFFDEVDSESYKKECARDSKISKFYDLYKQEFEIENDLFLALIRKTFHLNKFIFLGFNDLPEYYDAYNYKIQKKIESIECDGKKVYIINIAAVSLEWLKEFEKDSIKNDVIRLYIKENSRYIQIGPALNSYDFGCLFCDPKLENRLDKMVSTETELFNDLSPLTLALIDMELIKICRDVIESTTENITISNGKIFILDKVTMEAYQEEKDIDINCEICEVCK